MRHWNFAALLLSLTLFAPSPVAAQAADAKPEPGGNAALKYWQAFALLPALDKDQEQLVEDWNQVPLDAAAFKLIDRSQASRQYLYRGVNLPRCDWSLNYEDGVFLVMPYLPKSRTMSRLVALHARHEFELGHWKAGWDDVTALLRLARHLEMEPLAIQQLVGFSIETIAIKAAAPYLLELKGVLPKAASAVLEALPADPTPRQIVLHEKQISAAWLIQALKEAEQRQKGSWQEVWKNVFGAPQEGDVSRDLFDSAKTFEQAIKLLEELLPYFDELANVSALPWKEFDTQYPQFVKRLKAANPLATMIISMDHAMASERRNQTQRELFKAALAVVQDGPGIVKEIQDPFGDGPFEYRALSQGFELKSKLLVKGQPMTLTVGNRKKELSDRSESANNLKQIALAMHNYHDVFEGFPPAGISDVREKDGQPLLSWRVAILPYLGQEDLYRQFNLTEPWDSEHNRKLIPQMPPNYAAPGISSREPGMTYYEVFVGPGAAFEPFKRGPAKIRIPLITDGSANTLLVVEAGTPVIWTRPDDLPFDSHGKLPQIGGVFADGINAALCDGSVRFVRKNIDDASLRALITRNGGEPVNPEDFVRR